MSTTTYVFVENKKNIDTFWLKKSALSRAMTLVNGSNVICEQIRSRSACTSVQSDLSFFFCLLTYTIVSIDIKWTVKAQISPHMLIWA